MKVTTSSAQVTAGIILGIVLQPVSALLVIGLVYILAGGSEARGWGIMGAYLGYVFYFGMAQVLTILPSALLTLSMGREGVMRGLLYVGTALALLNVAILFVLYAVFRLPIIGPF